MANFWEKWVSVSAKQHPNLWVTTVLPLQISHLYCMLPRKYYQKRVLFYSMPTEANTISRKFFGQSRGLIHRHQVVIGKVFKVKKCVCISCVLVKCVPIFHFCNNYKWLYYVLQPPIMCNCQLSCLYTCVMCEPSPSLCRAQCYDIPIWCYRFFNLWNNWIEIIALTINVK